jgi:hypothetical protein
MMRRQLPAYSPLDLGSWMRAFLDSLREFRQGPSELARLLSQRYPCEKVVLTGSGTQALELSIRLALWARRNRDPRRPSGVLLLRRPDGCGGCRGPDPLLRRGSGDPGPRHGEPPEQPWPGGPVHWWSRASTDSRWTGMPPGGAAQRWAPFSSRTRPRGWAAPGRAGKGGPSEISQCSASGGARGGRVGVEAPFSCGNRMTTSMTSSPPRYAPPRWGEGLEPRQRPSPNGESAGRGSTVCRQPFPGFGSVRRSTGTQLPSRPCHPSRRALWRRRPTLPQRRSPFGRGEPLNSRGSWVGGCHRHVPVPFGRWREGRRAT